jgi:hypothetical protein
MLRALQLDMMKGVGRTAIEDGCHSAMLFMSETGLEAVHNFAPS